MENYYKGKNVEEELHRDNIPFKGIHENFLWMKVKGGSKMTNLLTHASGIIKDKASTAVIWSGVGVAISKAISCAEIIKRQLSIEHQMTKLEYIKVEEYWEPKIDGLETIVVKRQIPAIHILLSVDPISDNSDLGYQSLKGKKFWQENQQRKNKSQNSYKSKKPHKHRNKTVE